MRCPGDIVHVVCASSHSIRRGLGASQHSRRAESLAGSFQKSRALNKIPNSSAQKWKHSKRGPPQFWQPPAVPASPCRRDGSRDGDRRGDGEGHPQGPVFNLSGCGAVSTTNGYCNQHSCTLRLQSPVQELWGTYKMMVSFGS